MAHRPRALAAILALAGAAFVPTRGAAFDFFDGRLQIHGYAEEQIRTLADNYHPENANLAQWANVLDIEIEAALAPNGIGPFTSINGFARVLARYDCIYTGCGVVPTFRYYGKRADRAPRNYTDGRRNPYSGQELVPDAEANHTTYSHGHELLDVYHTPLLADLAKLGAPNLKTTFDPVDDGLYAVKAIDASIGNGTFTLGPWNPNARIVPVGALDVVPDPTLPLPMRPASGAPRDGGLYPHGLFLPSAGYVHQEDQFDPIEQNYSQTDLAWQHVQSQDERELKEAYLDVEMLDGRLYMRLGKQVIVWGKTEIFRNTDQFNPQTLALSTLPSLEESRIALWSAKGIYSFYDVGPLEDVRLELAANLDDYEPADLGRCGMPYAVWLVCGKTFGYWAHGVFGSGLAGDNRPPNWWDSVKGLEFGGRLEWRWDRFSFQLSDFWGYDDFPTVDTFNVYERKVDPFTGRPLGADGKPLLPTDDPRRILAQQPMNQQLFNVINSATVGIARNVFPQLADRGLLDIVNSNFQVVGIPIATAFTAVLGGSGTGQFVFNQLTGFTGGGGPSLIHLNRDPGDGPPSGIFGVSGLSVLLTDQQEALLGCGPFYGTSCDVNGIDVMNAEASVLVQSFPEFEHNAPIATRYVPGRGVVILPGARGPSDPGYSPLVDGCVAPGPVGCNAGDPGRIGPSANTLVNPQTGQLFRNELGAASYNFLLLLAGLGKSTGTDPGCDVNNPFTCLFVRGIFAIAGMQRPEVRAGGNGEWGRRDFVWSGGAEAQLIYPKRNVLGFAFDVDEDRTKTNWGVEATWIDGQSFAITSEPRGWGKRDTFNLAISVDRPTFINFLNPNRTFLFNAQVFMRYINDYVNDDRMAVHGPLSALWTLTAFTGYHQDRFLPAVTWVHDALSGSGGLIGSVTFRFTENFSATVGSAGFYGKPDKLQSLMVPLTVQNQGKSFKADLAYDGLSAIAERDEIYLLLRYTF